MGARTTARSRSVSTAARLPLGGRQFPLGLHPVGLPRSASGKPAPVQFVGADDRGAGEEFGAAQLVPRSSSTLSAAGSGCAPHPLLRRVPRGRRGVGVEFEEESPRKPR